MCCGELWKNTQRFQVKLGGQLNLVLFTFDVRQIVQRIGVRWIQFECLVVALFGLLNVSSFFEGVCQVAVGVCKERQVVSSNSEFYFLAT